MWGKDDRSDLARIERKLDAILEHLDIPDPTTAGVTPEIVGLVHSFSGDAKIRYSRLHLLDHLGGAALMECQVTVWIPRTERLHDLGHGITGLGVGGRNGKAA